MGGVDVDTCCAQLGALRRAKLGCGRVLGWESRIAAFERKDSGSDVRCWQGCYARGYEQSTKMMNVL